MFTKYLYEDRIFYIDDKWGLDYEQLFRCILLTPFTIFADIITSPFQFITLIVGMIIKKKKHKEKE